MGIRDRENGYSAARVCAMSSTGRHHYLVEGVWMVCQHCFQAQIYTENHTANWVRIEK